MGEKVDLDDIFKEIGQFGKYQVILMLIISFSVIFSGMGISEYVFSAGDLNYRCHIPECEGDEVNHENYHVPWFDKAIKSRCERYAPINNTTKQQTIGACPSDFFNINVTIPCEKFVYERTNTIVYERTLVGTIRSTGTLFVDLLNGFVSDRFGRRKALTLNAVARGIVGVTRSFSVNYEMFLALSLLESVSSGATFSIAHIYATESVGPKWRSIAAVTTASYMAFGEAICGLVAWNFPEWRIFTRVIYFPQLIAFIYFWILPESVRWLLSKKKYKEAEVILKKIAKTNGKKLSQCSLHQLTKSAALPVNALSFVETMRKSLGSKEIMKRLMIVPFWWVTVTFVYFGLTINSVGLAGNTYFNFILVALIEIPGYFMAALTLNIFGRKKSIFFSFMMCALACIALPSFDLAWIKLVTFLAGKFFISMTMTSIYIYTAELFPTQLRQTYLSFSSMFGQIGSMLAPQTPLLIQIWPPLPMVIFGSFAVISGSLVFLTPETNGTKLPDTIEETENMTVTIKL